MRKLLLETLKGSSNQVIQLNSSLSFLHLNEPLFNAACLPQVSHTKSGQDLRLGITLQQAHPARCQTRAPEL